MRKLAAGGVGEDFLQRPWTISSPPGIPLKLLPFLQSSGDFTNLTEALKSTPSLLWHPLILRLIEHLRDVRREHWDDLLGCQARTTLRAVVEAFASGLLRGAWSLKPPPKRPGRKRHDDTFQLLADFESIMKKFAGEFRKGRLRTRKGESRDQWALRVALAFERVWRRSVFSTEVGEPLQRATPDGDSLTLNDLHNEPMNVRDVPAPPRETILRWVKDAHERSRATGRPLRSLLTWRMLAHHSGLSDEQIRGRIDSERRWVKETL